MLTKTLLALFLATGSIVAVTNYNLSPNQEITEINQTISQLTTTEIEAIAQKIAVRVYVGKDRGSGIMIAKNNHIYQVITNAHVVERDETYMVQTADGVKHQAKVVYQDGTDRGNDLAILKFESSNNYQVGTLGNSDNLSVDEKVIAAGFPETQAGLLITAGKIVLLTEKPLKKGYAIAFSNPTSQGMSGGVLLNGHGEVIGVLGKGKDALLDTAYDYFDSTKPTDREIEAFRAVSFAIPIANIAELSPQLVSLLTIHRDLDIAQQPKTITSKQKTEYTGIVQTVDNIAQQITVRIATPKISAFGSGVMIARQGNTYYVATAKHVVRDRKQYQIVTPDDATYLLDNATIKQSDVYDFAIFSFTSAQDYTVANLGNYTVAANDEQIVFVAGFPHLKKNSFPQRLITGGKVIQKERTNFRTKDSNSFLSITPDRPGLLYTNLSYKGMSGGAVLDSEGRLIGINTAAENEIYFEGNNQEYSLGYSLGVPIRDIFGFLSQKTELKTEWLQTISNPAAKVADNDWEGIKTQLLNVEQPKDDRDLIAWMNLGNQLWRYQQYKDAVDAFERVIAIEPNFHKAYYAMGLAHRDREQYPQAVTSFTKATQIDPNPYYYWRYLGFVYRELKQYDRAILAYEQAIAKNPQDFVLYIEQGDVLREARRDSEAVPLYNEALKINPEHPWIYNNRGLTYFNLAEYQRAIADYKRAIELNPQDAFAYTNLGSVYNNLEQYDLALADLNKAIAIDPQLAEAYNNRGLIYEDLQEYERAVDDYVKAISLDPEYAYPYLNRGNIYDRLGEKERAIADYSRAIAIDPEYALAYNNRGTVYNDLKQYDKAINDLEKAISLDPDLPLAYNNRGLTYNELKEYDKALANYDRAIALNPQSVEAYNNRGITYNSLQQYERAIEDYNSALSLDPQLAEGYNNRGIIYDELGKYERALKDFDRAISLHPHYIEAYYNRGNAYNDLEKYERALSDFDRAISLYPQSAQAYIGRGFAYAQLQKVTQAIQAWEQAANLFEQQNQLEKANKIREILQQLNMQ